LELAVGLNQLLLGTQTFLNRLVLLIVCLADQLCELLRLFAEDQLRCLFVKKTTLNLCHLMMI
jgi:hypothetical protein